MLASLTGAWGAGVAALFAGEILAFPDLPRPSALALLSSLSGGAVRYLPLAVGIALVLAAASAGFSRRSALFDRVRAFVVLWPFLAPGLVVLLFAKRLSPSIGVFSLIASLVVSLVLAAWFGRERRASWALVILVLASPLWLTLFSRVLPGTPQPGTPLASAQGKRVVLLGVDGATWDIMRPMMARGELPAFALLAGEGASGPLTSLEPTLSNRVWTSASTGVVPDRHGITDFYFDRRFIEVPTMWDLVHAHGGRVGLFEYLVTDPPFPFHGFVLPGWMAYNPTTTHPPDLTTRLRVAASLRHPTDVARYFLTRKRVDPRHAQRMMLEAKLVATGFLFLHERYRPDLAACIFYGTDRLGHTAWRYFEPEAFEEALPEGGEAFQGVLPAYYREADRQIGRIVSSLDDGHTLFVVMSDHGMGAMDSVRVAGHTRGLRALQKLDLADRWYVENPHGEMFLNCKLPSRVENATVLPEDHERVVEEAAARFAAVEVAATHEKVFHVELGDFEKVDLEITIPRPRSLTLDMPLRYDGATFPAEEIIQLVELSGTHRIDGIAILRGPGVRRGSTLEGAMITDIAPTVLWALGLPVAEDLDGKVLASAFTEEWGRAHPQTHVSTFGTVERPTDAPKPPTEDLLEKLRGLGYIN